MYKFSKYIAFKTHQITIYGDVGLFVLCQHYLLVQAMPCVGIRVGVWGFCLLTLSLHHGGKLTKAVFLFSRFFYVPALEFVPTKVNNIKEYVYINKLIFSV